MIYEYFDFVYFYYILLSRHIIYKSINATLTNYYSFK